MHRAGGGRAGVSVAGLPARAARLPVLRQAVAAAAEASSYRTVARELGLSPRTLRLFVEGGSVPRARTMARVRAWYVRRGASTDVSPDTAAAALGVLVRELPSPEREEAAAGVVALIESAFLRRDAQLPAWLLALAARPASARPVAASPSEESRPIPRPPSLEAPLPDVR